MNPSQLGDMSQALLDNIAADFAAAGLPALARKVITHGPPVRECRQLAVWWQTIQPGQGGRTLPLGQYVETVPHHLTHVVTFAIDLVLCGPSGSKVPTMAQITAAAVEAGSYTWTMYRGLAHRWVAGTIFAPVYAMRPAKDAGPPSVQQPLVDGGLMVVTSNFPVRVEG